MTTAQHRARESQRDAMFTNASEPAPTGSVSEATLTSLRHERLAAASGRAGLPADLTRNVQAATLPPVAPGQARSGETSGVRNESSRFERGTGTGKNTPER
ncbi:hypothetical protein EV651_102504 [Kribbella sp. VKM Ac-2571]|uniref:hypothetical protein n=1 Tax=Kribbella sp. VKM Ac-2571 TaxID=2512222 RepID=UPI00105F0C3F|nr:hypothetical protein [Kribbella sp. VKM Ac-2571]TDO68581.1 hypothetical protein EV651_102504 [Kribbella sp. VKM Ac-2571]